MELKEVDLTKTKKTFPKGLRCETFTIKDNAAFKIQSECIEKVRLF